MSITKQPTINENINKLIKRYLSNDITQAIVIGGLEPFDQFKELYNFIKMYRAVSTDDIVIYTGYIEKEINEQVNLLLDLNKNGNLIIKYGRFIGDNSKKYDDILGIYLASSNQYAVMYNKV